MAFQPPPKPKSALGYHRILAPVAGVRVSPLCLGSMNFGNAWKEFMGECNKETSFSILDHFFENGGNFIDTASNYQNEESEKWLGEWMETRKNRDQIVLATKFTTCYPAVEGPEKIRTNFQGNHAKSLRVSLEASLKKLRTDYIDILYVHWWDFSTSIPEVMQSLHKMVMAGKVLYLGISDTPAWIVAKANEYARNHALSQFVIYQGKWNAGLRDFERDILPMCESEGMAIAPWGALGGGNFKSREQREAAAHEGRHLGDASQKDILISEKLEEIAKKKGTLITSVALAYIMHKYPWVYPIVGGRKVDHLRGNIEALTLELTEQEIDDIESAVPFDAGFPLAFLYGFTQEGFKYSTRLSTKDLPLVKVAGYLDVVDGQAPIRPRKI
ncbi:norsolorinic acid reductase/dehydrogenase [Gaertneriomyces semiglobifer]|nr:norsolorinic acid reductase/dehydrogenase [Gaertneriomyces semiglobifer]